MYSSFQLLKKYFNYYFSAKNGKGHGIHSPFVFDFVTHVLNDKKKYDCYENIEALRQNFLADKSIVEVEDFGAGSGVIPFRKRPVNAIAKSSLKSEKLSQLLFRVAKYYNSQIILELGTSLGITTCYFARANGNASVYTFEGSPAIAKLARKNFVNAGVDTIKLVEGKFDETLLPVLNNLTKVDLAFIDGNHRKEPTLHYFSDLLKKSTNDSIFIFDDIHWSTGMEEAWKQIQQHDSVTLTIDLFFLGFVFFKNEFKVKQHFKIRF
jgi:predicted O-methyltransferase YrrM